MAECPLAAYLPEGLSRDGERALWKQDRAALISCREINHAKKEVILALTQGRGGPE